MAHPRDRELGRLVEQGAIDDVLAMVSLETIADSWCAYHAIDHDRDAVDDDVQEADSWAVEFFLVWDATDRRRDALLALVASARGDSRVLSNIGAGPFEDYLDVFDPDDVTWIEHHAALSPPFQDALSNMRLPRDLADDARVRINRAAGFDADRWLKFDP